VTWTGDKITKAKAGVYSASLDKNDKEKNLKIGEAYVYKDDEGSSSGGAHVKSFEYRNKVSGIDIKGSGPSAGADFAFNRDNVGFIVSSFK